MFEGTAAAPVPAPVEPKAQATPKSKIGGQGECRRFDAISNMTIAVACPD
jgi:hypothetical protein